MPSSLPAPNSLSSWCPISLPDRVPVMDGVATAMPSERFEYHAQRSVSCRVRIGKRLHRVKEPIGEAALVLAGGVVVWIFPYLRRHEAEMQREADKTLRRSEPAAHYESFYVCECFTCVLADEETVGSATELSPVLPVVGEPKNEGVLTDPNLLAWPQIHFQVSLTSIKEPPGRREEHQMQGACPQY